MDKTTGVAAKATAKTSDLHAEADIAPATTFSTSGAPAQLSPNIDIGSPAVDNNPRAGTSVLQNQIHFNDPTASGPDAVAAALGMKTEAEAAKEASVAEKPKG